MNTTPPRSNLHNGRYRTHTCGELREANIDESVRLSGWVHRLRDHGGLLFIDLRDHYGITQIVIDPDSAAFQIASKVHAEWVVTVDGTVRARPEGATNNDLPSGNVEVFAVALEVLSAASELPLQVFGDREYPEELRLQYRYLDLRRDALHRNIVLRSAVVRRVRELMNASGFTEFTTPILTASSPEGARDYLVPSRRHPSKFYALPQAPQQFKQLIMMSGFDRYFQIAPCFRDEDSRADRAPGEFYQLDLEMSFVEQEDIFQTVEPIIRTIFEEFGGGKPVSTSFSRIPYDEAIAKYGSDKPDLRNPITMRNVSETFRGSEFALFATILESEPRTQVWAVPVNGTVSRALCDRMNSWAQEQGQPGLAYMMFRDGKATGPVAKKLGGDRTAALKTSLGLGSDDAVFFVAGDPAKFCRFAGAVRDKLGQELNLIDEDRFEFAWIVDFPMYEWNEEEGKIDFSHNPFSMPQGGLEVLAGATTRHDILAIKAYQYDIVCNGVELSSGAIRNHKPEVMKKAFEIAGYAEDVLLEKFGGMYQAFKYGAPPHGGIAPGIDRILMLLVGAKNLRDVILFPMNQQAQDLMMGAPGTVSEKQLRELHIRPR